VDEADEHFYDHTLANATIQRLHYVAQKYHASGENFFLMNGFARPHAPWRVYGARFPT
jgi:hypothetical protein